MAHNEAEQFLFREYCSLYGSHGFDLPALIPQVYLHLDPYTKQKGGTLVRQRMDFLLLLPNRKRVVLELDGMQHYADATTRQAKPGLYADMVAEDRRLRLAGYEVYRFGGTEFVDRDRAARMLAAFFHELLQL
jgi:very-short-patch-repair endonuclease